MADNPYQAAGVDTDALASIKDRIAGFARLTHGPEVLGGAGGFAGLFQLQGYDNPILVASTDGVGTKLKVASLLGHYESLGIDLVNLNIDDVLTQGAKPIFFLDYVATSDKGLDWIDSLVRGMTWACREAGCALIGGETAQMPGVYAEGDFDLAGFIVGVVEEKQRLDSSTVEAGDVLVGVPSSGLHTNGFSLVRRVFGIDENPNVLYEHHQELAHSLGEELLIPHRSYYPVPVASAGQHQGDGPHKRRRPDGEHAKIRACGTSGPVRHRQLAGTAYIHHAPTPGRDRPHRDVPSLQHGLGDGHGVLPGQGGFCAG